MGILVLPPGSAARQYPVVAIAAGE
jgi:hypothetical protein